MVLSQVSLDSGYSGPSKMPIVNQAIWEFTTGCLNKNHQGNPRKPDSQLEVPLKNTQLGPKSPQIKTTKSHKTFPAEPRIQQISLHQELQAQRWTLRALRHRCHRRRHRRCGRRGGRGEAARRRGVAGAGSLGAGACLNKSITGATWSNKSWTSWTSGCKSTYSDIHGWKMLEVCYISEPCPFVLFCVWDLGQDSGR